MRQKLLTLTILALLATPVMAQEALPPPAPHVPPRVTTLEVMASADVTAAPDVATISSGVVSHAGTAAAALASNAEAMNKVFAALKALGIPAADIQTSGLSINPQYAYKENEAPTVTGYQASNNVNIRLVKLDTVGSVIDALVKEGANQINGPTFGIDKPDPLLDNARREAITKARARAELMATAAGLKVGRIVSISESGAQAIQPPMPMMRMSMAAAQAAPTPVAAGQLTLTAGVTVVYELVP